MRKNIEKGDRVKIVGDHPWKGHEGVYVGIRQSPMGVRMRIELDNTIRCLARRHNVKKV